MQRGDAPGACSGPIWGFGLVSFVLMAGLQLRAEGRAAPAPRYSAHDPRHSFPPHAESPDSIPLDSTATAVTIARPARP